MAFITPPPTIAGGVNGGGGNTSGGFDPADLILAPDNKTVYGYKRTFNPQTGAYGYETVQLGSMDNLNGVSSASGIPVGALQTALSQKLYQNLSTIKDTNQIAYGKMLGMNPDGSFSYYNPQGQLEQGTAQEATNAGISPADIQQAMYQGQTVNWQTAANPGLGGYSYQQYTEGTDNAQAPYDRTKLTQEMALNPIEYYNRLGQDQLNAANLPFQLSQVGIQQYNTGNENLYNAGKWPFELSQQGVEQGNTAMQNIYQSKQLPWEMSMQPYQQQADQTGVQKQIQSNSYDLGSSGYTNDYSGENRLGYRQVTQESQDQYDRAMANYNSSTAGQQVANKAYQQNIQTTQAQNASGYSGTGRNLTGVGAAALTRPQIAGYS